METFQMEFCVRGYSTVFTHVCTSAYSNCSPLKNSCTFNIRHLSNWRKFPDLRYWLLIVCCGWYTHTQEQLVHLSLEWLKTKRIWFPLLVKFLLNTLLSTFFVERVVFIQHGMPHNRPSFNRRIHEPRLIMHGEEGSDGPRIWLHKAQIWGLCRTLRRLSWQNFAHRVYM